MAIRNQYALADERLKSYLTAIGRRKLVLPSTRPCSRRPRDESCRCHLRQARPGYHPITAESVDRLLKGPGEGSRIGKEPIKEKT